LLIIFNFQQFDYLARFPGGAVPGGLPE
jgi:hypothetical protein